MLSSSSLPSFFMNKSNTYVVVDCWQKWNTGQKIEFFGVLLQHVYAIEQETASEVISYISKYLSNASMIRVRYLLDT